jgi:hypothetical protein
MMSKKISGFVRAWTYIGVSVLLVSVAGCKGPLAPTPGFGDEVRATREAMVANPNAGVENTELVDGISPSTAEGVVENYHEAETYDNQKERQEGARAKSATF